MYDNMKFFTDGAAYEQLMGRWSRLVGDIFLDWVAAPLGLRWLDAGCGNGAFTETIIARCAPAEVAGIDPSEAQIAYARGREPAKGAKFHIGDAQALPFPNARFDAAAMALVISFVPAPAKAAAEMARVVRPGGWVDYMWDLPNGGLPLAPLGKAARALGLKPPPQPPNAEVSRLENMQALWNGAGLKHRGPPHRHRGELRRFRGFLEIHHRAWQPFGAIPAGAAAGGGGAGSRLAAQVACPRTQTAASVMAPSPMP